MKNIKKCLYERVSTAKETQFILLTAPIEKSKGWLSILNANSSLKMFWKKNKIKNRCKIYKLQKYSTINQSFHMLSLRKLV